MCLKFISYCINREEAFKLHNELLNFDMNVPVNSLYTTRDLKKDYEYRNKKISKKFDNRTPKKQKIVKDLWNLAGHKDATGNELRLPDKDDFNIFNREAAKKLMSDLFDGREF